MRSTERAPTNILKMYIAHFSYVVISCIGDELVLSNNIFFENNDEKTGETDY